MLAGSPPTTSLGQRRSLAPGNREGEFSLTFLT
jgi:hypothetical protein